MGLSEVRAPRHPEPAELERRATRLLESYDGKMGGGGHLVLREDAVAFFKERLKRAKYGCVSDPDWGSYVLSGGNTRFAERAVYR